MKKDFIENLISGLRNPGRVLFAPISEELVYIGSAENTNDTLDWFYVNSMAIEEALQKEGLTWCYLFETAPSSAPLVYMFIGKNITEADVRNIFEDSIDELPEDRELYYELKPFQSIDIDNYDHSITDLEKVATRYASDVFRVYEP